MKHELHLGDCLDVLKTIPENSVDSIVTDPPYGLSFMGKKWDYDVPSVEIWKECLRVLKPGGHLLAFAGTRTQHRMAVRIEDAGFEIRDCIMWHYGSGFPKSLDVSKAVDKLQGNEREHVGPNPANRPYNLTKGETSTGWKSPPRPDKDKGYSEWEGWGTALKPATEIITMARKPLSEKTVAENVLEWGTGGINIDACRVQHDEPIKTTTRTEKGNVFNEKNSGLRNNPSNMASADPKGRFPANAIFDEEAGKLLDEQSGNLSTVGSPKKVDSSKTSMFGAGVPGFQMYGDSGGASRFFYCPKTSKKDRNEGLEKFEEKQAVGGGGGIGDYKNDVNSASGKFGSEKAPSKNHHPTVKPTDLMLYLIKLVTKPEGTTLDPFMGSGSTGKAAMRGNFKFIGIEREQDFYNIAQARINHEAKKPKQQTFEF